MNQEIKEQRKHDLETFKKRELNNIKLTVIPKDIYIVQSEYLEKACNFLKPEKLRGQSLVRVCVLSQSILLKQMLAGTFYLYLHEI